MKEQKCLCFFNTPVFKMCKQIEKFFFKLEKFQFMLFDYISLIGKTQTKLLKFTLLT